RYPGWRAASGAREAGHARFSSVCLLDIFWLRQPGRRIGCVWSSGCLDSLRADVQFTSAASHGRPRGRSGVSATVLDHLAFLEPLQILRPDAELAIDFFVVLAQARSQR